MVVLCGLMSWVVRQVWVQTMYSVVKGLVRLLRKRIVLAIIFSLSFTYCLVSLLSHKSGTGGAMDGTVEDYETNVDIDHLQHMIRQSQHLSQTFIKHNESLDLNGNADKELSAGHLDVNSDDSKGVVIGGNGGTNGGIGGDVKCRNSIQGKVLIADDRGMVCHRKDVLLSGCCDEHSVNSRLYSCETCQVCNGLQTCIMYSLID